MLNHRDRLTEFVGVKQIKGEKNRRWFQSNQEDLIVWYNDDGSIYGFQFCYDKSQFEQAFTWMPEGYSHTCIDDGENAGLTRKSIPVLVPNAMLDTRTVVQKFRTLSGQLPSDLVEFIVQKLQTYYAHT